MARMIELDWNPDDRTLRQFGWIALVGFCLLAGAAWQEWLIFAAGLGDARTAVAGGLAALGVLAALASLVYPRANRPLFLGLSLVAFPIGFVLSYLILGTLFFGIITPMGLALRLFGRDAMSRGFRPDVDSYWTPARPAPDRARYFKQF